MLLQFAWLYIQYLALCFIFESEIPYEKKYWQKKNLADLVVIFSADKEKITILVGSKLGSYLEKLIDAGTEEQRD